MTTMRNFRPPYGVHRHSCHMLLLLLLLILRSGSANENWFQKIKKASPFWRSDDNYDFFEQHPTKKTERNTHNHERIDRERRSASSSAPDHDPPFGLTVPQSSGSRLPFQKEDKKWWETIPFDKLGKRFAASVQFGLLCYMTYTIWQAVSEVIEEYVQEISGVSSSGFSRDMVNDALQFLEQPPNDAKTQLERAQMESGSSATSSDLPHLPTLQIAQKLSLAGLPLRSSNHDKFAGLPGSINHGPNMIQKPSVEAVLLSLTRPEASLLHQCLWAPSPNDRTTASWNDVVGLDRVKTGLMSSLQTTLGAKSSRAFDSLFDHSSTQGVLLYGPPGCGKSFLIRALSSQAKIPCLVITPSVLLRKYVGETNQQCRALFSLAQKLAPCILCIDEVDGLFRERSESEHEVSRDLKTEFLQHLDGMMSRSNIDSTSGQRRRNLVVAATNRPFDVDSAILRRLTQSHYVSMPDVAARSGILEHLLKSVPTDPDDLDLWMLATRTEGYSPSDLRQLLQEAATSGPLRESPTNPPPLTTHHVLHAMHSVPPTPLSSMYRWSLASFAQSQNPEQQSVQPVPMSSPLSPQTGMENMISKWETNYGNFYHLGGIEIDRESFELLEQLSETMAEFMAEQQEDFMDEEDDDFGDDEL